MRSSLIACAAALSGLLLSGCSNGAARVWGAPVTDITLTSTEAYAQGSPFNVIASHRQDGRLTLDLNVVDRGRAEAIAREAVGQVKDGASTVLVNVYGPEGHPPEEPMLRLEWTRGRGFARR